MTIADWLVGLPLVTRMAVEPILGIGKVRVSFDPLLLPAF